MSGETIGAWAVFGVSALLYAWTALTAGVSDSRAPGARVLRGLIEGDNGSVTPGRAHDPAVGVAARSLSYAALLAGVAAIFVALGEYLSDESQRGVIVAAGFAVGLALVHGSAGTLRVSERRLSHRVVRPVEIVLEGLAAVPGVRGLLMRISGTRSGLDEGEDVVTAAFEQNLDILEAAGVATDVEELRMIRGVLDLDTTRVREIMSPRVDMVVAPADATRRRVADMMTAEGYSKIPVYEDQIDHIVGIVYARDLLRAELGDKGGEHSIVDLIRPAIFVPETQFLEHLLQEFQRQRVQMAIVVDEYGGVSGLVTHQDLVEEIVGEIEDEFDTDEPELQAINENEYLVDARLTLDDLNETFSTTIEGDGFDTVGGLVYRELGRMPYVGDLVAVDGLSLTVRSTTGRRIRKVHVRRREPLAENA